jgi:Papain family cysteine protease
LSDHRADQTPIRNQGDRSTCVAFAVSAAHEWMAGEARFHSPEDALWAGHQVQHVPGREETSVAAALQGLATHAHATEAAWPYGNPAYPADRPENACDPANQGTLPTWHALPSISIQAIAHELERPVAVLLTVKFVWRAWRVPGGEIDADAEEKTPANHAILAVGVQEQPERIIIKNSWGERWGIDGYGFMTERYLNHYGLRAHVLEAT